MSRDDLPVAAAPLPELKASTRSAITIGSRFKSFNAAIERSRQSRLGKNDSRLRLAFDMARLLAFVALVCPLIAALIVFWLVIALLAIIGVVNFISDTFQIMITGCHFGQSECLLFFAGYGRARRTLAHFSIDKKFSV